MKGPPKDYAPHEARGYDDIETKAEWRRVVRIRRRLLVVAVIGSVLLVAFWWPWW